ncbi:MAG TPA: FecR domain-containing protein [Terrimicrobiaceae bacterium]
MAIRNFQVAVDFNGPPNRVVEEVCQLAQRLSARLVLPSRDRLKLVQVATRESQNALPRPTRARCLLRIRSKLRRLIFNLLLFTGHLAALRSEPFEQAEVTKTINLVSLLPQDIRAVPGDIVKEDTALQTAGNSRAELRFPDLTIVRVGSNSLFRFLADSRESVLESGTILFSSPKGAGGGKVRAGSITAAVTGSDFMISNLGRVKVICLSHKVAVYFTANPKIRAELLPGQMLDIVAGADRRLPPVTTINLGKLLATSMLSEAGGFAPLPSQAILTQNVNKQGKAFLVASANLTSQSAETERSTIVANDPLFQSRQTAAATTAREAAATASTPDKSGNGSGENQVKHKNGTESPGNSGNQENRGSAGNNEKRGNVGNNENRGNLGNNENRGNAGNNENHGNAGNNESRGNAGSNENHGNAGSNENHGNAGSNENHGNAGNNENRGNAGNNENRGNAGNNENRGNAGNNENRGNAGNNENRGNAGNNESRGKSVGRERR